MLCVGVTLLMLAVTLVGTMLSVGSRYQEMVFAKKWEGSFTKNKSASMVTTTGSSGGGGRYSLVDETFVIVPEVMDEDDGDDGEEDEDDEETSTAKNSTAIVRPSGGRSRPLFASLFVDYWDRPVPQQQQETDN